MEDSVREAYDATWSNRRSSPIVMDSWTMNEWAKGRTDYLTFLIRVRDEQVFEKVRSVQDTLVRHRCLDAFPAEYLHVTVKEIGCFLVHEKTQDDELTKEDVTGLVEAAEKALKGMESFNIKFSRVNHFRSNIVVEAHDDGSVREMNRRLKELAGVKQMAYDYPKFLPHLSICQFHCDENHDVIVDTLEEMRNVSIGGMKASDVDLVKAILPKGNGHPVLEVLHTFKLG